ncbi:hypothetical protein O6H91_06G020500 [Diphasiastrum complanatum]|uniref:Uncharacterized protein n=1 Tax=Diphasiastrum complanatum TaxID=34168 RepID=A0ACC2DB68_DIPCM|nr:hypothetical protein O6H91_06G020500 [Diphasiastrum complanatum]
MAAASNGSSSYVFGGQDQPCTTLAHGFRLGNKSNGTLMNCQIMSYTCCIRPSSKCKHVRPPFVSSKALEREVYNVHLEYIFGSQGANQTFVSVSRDASHRFHRINFSHMCNRRVTMPSAWSRSGPCKSWTGGWKGSNIQSHLLYLIDTGILTSISDSISEPGSVNSVPMGSFVQSDEKENADGSSELSVDISSKDMVSTWFSHENYDGTVLNETKQPYLDDVSFDAYEKCSEVSFDEKASSGSLASKESLGVDSENIRPETSSQLLSTTVSAGPCSEGITLEHSYPRTTRSLDWAESRWKQWFPSCQSHITMTPLSEIVRPQPDFLSSNEMSSSTIIPYERVSLESSSATGSDKETSYQERLPGISVSHIQKCIDPCRIFVQGFPFSMRGIAMKKDLLSSYGTVKDIEFATYSKQTKKSLARGKHRGYAFVLMASPEEAKAAIENLNGQYHWGRLLTVSAERTF